MKNRVLILVVCILSMTLVECSSKSKQNNSSSPNSNPDQDSSTFIEDAHGTKDTKSSVLPNQSLITSIPSSPKGSSGADKSTYLQLNQYIKNQDEDSILREGSVILMKNPNDIKAINAMAMSYYKRGQYALAKSLLLRAMKVEPGSYEVHSNMGVVLLALTEKNEALKSFKKSIELNPSDYVSASNAGSLYVVEQDFEKAAVVLEIAYSKGYRNSKVLNNYGIALTAMGKYEKADKIYREALKENNNDKSVLFNHAILLIQFMKKNDEGLEIIKKLKFLGVPDEARKKFQDLQAMVERK